MKAMASRGESSQSPRMFESDFIDYFSRCPFWIVPILYVPATLAMLVASHSYAGMGWLATAGLALGGFAFWTLAEYWLHRTVFHFEPYSSQVGMRLHWMIHGVHHDHPNDPMRLVMPPSVSVPLALVLEWLFALLLGLDAALVFGGGFFAGYLAYDMLHYHVHHHMPRTPVGRRLRELHMRHHFQDDERGFGISAPYWDRVFGTAPASTGNRGLRESGAR